MLTGFSSSGRVGIGGGIPWRNSASRLATTASASLHATSIDPRGNRRQRIAPVPPRSSRPTSTGGTETATDGSVSVWKPGDLDAVLRIAESTEPRILQEENKCFLLCYTRFSVNSRFVSPTELAEADVNWAAGIAAVCFLLILSRVTTVTIDDLFVYPRQVAAVKVLSWKPAGFKYFPLILLPIRSRQWILLSRIY